MQNNNSMENMPITDAEAAFEKIYIEAYTMEYITIPTYKKYINSLTSKINTEIPNILYNLIFEDRTKYNNKIQEFIAENKNNNINSNCWTYPNGKICLIGAFCLKCSKKDFLKYANLILNLTNSDYANFLTNINSLNEQEQNIISMSNKRFYIIKYINNLSFTLIPLIIKCLIDKTNTIYPNESFKQFFAYEILNEFDLNKLIENSKELIITNNIERHFYSH